MNNRTALSGFYLIAAWIITIGIVIMASKTKIGYTLLFFFAIASIVIVLAIGSPMIAKIFAAATIQNPTVKGKT